MVERGSRGPESHRKLRPVDRIQPGWSWRDTGYLLVIVAVFALICWLELTGQGIRHHEGPIPPPPSARGPR